MSPSVNLGNYAVGYSRVSTEKQSTVDDGLTKQRKRIVECCEAHGFTIDLFFKEIGSGRGPQTFIKRPELQKAITEVQQNDGFLIVTDPTRLFRNQTVAKKVLKNSRVKVFSVDADRLLTRKELFAAILQGEKSAANIVAGTNTALRELQSRGVKLGSKQENSGARAASILARKASASSRISSIADVLAEDISYESLSRTAVSELLNRRAIQTSRNLFWSSDNIGRDIRHAKQMLSDRKDKADEILEREAIAQAERERKKSDDLEREKQEEEDDLEKAKADPLWGMF